MSVLKEIFPFLAPIHFTEIEERNYLPSQIGKHITILKNENMDIDEVDIFIIGCGEIRGQVYNSNYSDAPNTIREEFYKLHYWHHELKLVDLGNIIEGKSMNDTKAALRTVLSEIHLLGKKVVVLGGSHDLTLQQYDVYKAQQEIIDFTVIDMLADLDDQSENRYDSYLMEALTHTPNYVRHFNLIGFQSYYVNPTIIETFDRLRFDCFRLGKVREDMEDMEPCLRNSHVVSIDINAIKYSDAPANKLCSPNGFFGDEMCKLTRFAGMSQTLGSMGIYGYIPHLDTENITAKLIAQMLWYFVDGVALQKIENDINDKSQFLEYQISFTNNNCLFLKSKKTNRWWMQLPNENFIPCSYKDYITACNNEIPERWMREVERLV